MLGTKTKRPETSMSNYVDDTNKERASHGGTNLVHGKYLSLLFKVPIQKRIQELPSRADLRIKPKWHWMHDHLRVAVADLEHTLDSL